jgi:PAS domain S-box-containing protein
VEPLTARELTVLEWLATPFTQRRIAAELCVSLNTIKTHVKQIYRKFGVSSRDEAVQRARSLRLLEDDAAAPVDFQALVTHTRSLITVIDAHRRIVWANGAFQDLLGFDPKLYVGRPSWELVHPDDYDRVTRIFRETSATPGASATFECRLAHADGTWRHVEVHQVNRIHDPAVRGFVGTTRELARSSGIEGSVHGEPGYERDAHGVFVLTATEAMQYLLDMAYVYETRDSELFERLHRDDVRWTSPVATCSGRGATWDRAMELADAVPDLRAELIGVSVDTEHNVASYEYRVTGTHVRPLRVRDRWYPATGKPFEYVSMAVVTFDDEGLASEIRAYFDFIDIVRQVGLAEAAPGIAEPTHQS